MNQQCKVCGEPAAGFHFGAFTCEGCKSFFGRSYNNLGSITECKNNGECVINKKNRTACKACRLRKCLLVGMSKSGSRYGRRSNWFKIHCLLQEQQQAAMASLGGKSPVEHTYPLSFPPPFLHPEPPSSISSPDSESSETGHPTYLPVSFPSVFMGSSPFLLHPHLFPFPPPPIKPEAPLTPSEEESSTKPPTSPILNNNYDSKNNNLERNPKRFYLDAILGLQRDKSPPREKIVQNENVQENPIDLSVRSNRSPSRSNQSETKLEVKSLSREEVKGIPLDLTV